MFSLEGRRALVTGATGGIGGAIARALAGQGARVALSGTRADALAALGEELGGAPVLAARLDLAGEVEGLVPAAMQALGGLDILVNNAGITRDNLGLRMKDEEWDAVLAVNLSAAFRLARAALRPMMKARAGRIISITSVVGHMGNPGQANYAAAKAGLGGMTRALAAEVAGRGVTVNCVAPGFIASPMTDALPEAVREGLLGRIPAGRLGTGEDVAAAVAYLASDAAAYVTGQTLHVNGGMLMP
jgi:3-oxoacyl-[acyl-carrier protein] reductase